MYIIYCTTFSIILAFLYEIFGIDFINIKSFMLSFVLFFTIILIISNPEKRYKRNIFIFFCIISTLTVANILKIRFNSAEISFFDFKLIKTATDTASHYMDKLPYGKIFTICMVAFLMYLFSLKYKKIFDYAKNKIAYKKYEPYVKKVENFMCNKYFKTIPLTIIFLFFTNFQHIYINYGSSSFFELIISAMTLVQSHNLYADDNQQQINYLIAQAKNSPLSNVDKKDPLLSGYPYNRQEDIDVVIIQSESFFDISKHQEHLGKNGIKIHHKDILSNFHHYQNRGISGYLYVPVVGGGTVNSEYEVLTGYAAKYFPQGSIIFTSIIENKTNSLAYYMKHYINNANTIAIHHHNKEFWERDRVYPLLGIDKFVDETKFSQEQRNDWVGGWMSDKTTFDMTRTQLEKNKEKNNFILSVTVQNHGAYIGKKKDIKVSNLTDSDEYEVSNYVSCMEYSDEQLGIFMDYIDKREKPTIVVFYGDHKPDTNYDIFKESKYYQEQDDEGFFTHKFRTSYFIYFNDAIKDEKLRSLSGTEKDLTAPALNRYIQMLLGDRTRVSMYIYNYIKNKDNYFDKLAHKGIKSTIHREMSIYMTNECLDYKKFE